MALEGLVDPYEEFWERAAQVEFSPQELQYEQQIKNTGPSLAQVATGLGAAFMLYRLYMARRIHQEMKRLNRNDASTLQLVASALYQGLVPRWVGVTAPIIALGYAQGVREARSGEVPEEILEQIATNYAEQLGTHLNDVSYEAMMQGYQAQVNRKVPAARAAERVARAYGVTPRAMNAIVSSLTLEDPKRLTSAPVAQIQDTRIGGIITSDLAHRAKAVGESESWAAKSQAKQIVWMYGMEKGVIPSDAKRMWVTAKDEKVCKICGPLHKKSVDIGEKFETDSGDFWSPPTHINCRCDITLDFNLTPDLQGELAAMIDAETVTKAYDDPRTAYWDARDTSGKFTRGTKVKVADPRFSTIKLPDTKIEVPDPVKAPEGKLKSEKLSGTKLSSGKLKPLEKLPASKLSAPAQAKLDAAKPEKVRATKLQPIKLPSIQKIIASTPAKLKAPKETKHGQWVPLDTPLMALLEDQEADATSWWVDAEQAFVPLDDRSERHPPGYNQLQVQVNHFWDSYIERELDFYRDNAAGDIYYGPDGVKFDVDEDAYEAALHESINNIPHAGSTRVTLESFGGEVITISAYELASQLGLREKVHDERPVFIITNQGIPGETRENPNYRGSDVWQNPGKWQESVDYEEHEQQLSHKPYRIVWVEPMD